MFKYYLSELKIITIPVGNYNANSLITILNTLIDDSNFSITISRITGKLKFSHNKDFIIYTDNDCSIGSILGFELNNTYNSRVGLTPRRADSHFSDP